MLQQPCLLGPRFLFTPNKTIALAKTAPRHLYCEGGEDEMEAVDTEGGNVEKEETLDGKGADEYRGGVVMN